MNIKRRDLQCYGDEQTVPDVAPRAMPQIVAQAGEDDTPDVTFGDSKLWL